MPLCTQSQWGWHSTPIPDGLNPAELRLENFDTYGRPVGYATSGKGQEPLYNWLRENPHRLNLGRISLLLDGQPLRLDDIAEVHQTLDLWTGILDSRFRLRGQPVHVRTCCHPGRDCVAVTVESPLLAAQSLSIALDFPYGSTGMNASDWSHADRHETQIVSNGRRHGYDIAQPRRRLLPGPPALGRRCAHRSAGAAPCPAARAPARLHLRIRAQGASCRPR